MLNIKKDFIRLAVSVKSILAILTTKILLEKLSSSLKKSVLKLVLNLDL